MLGSDVALPYNYEPRPHQLPVWQARSRGVKRMLLVWPRRSGKDKTAINIMAAASQARLGTYYYFMPTYAQGKKIVWDGMDKEGFKFTSHFPKEIVADTNETEMQLQLKNGSVAQIIGTDKIDSVVGTNPIGCVFSEFSLQDPRAWELVRPILRENGGWAIFLYTPRGRNHAYRLHMHNQRNPNWYCQLLTADMIPGKRDEMNAELEDGMDPELAEQEYMCSYSGSMEGAYYAKQIAMAERDGRICDVPYDPNRVVETWWDIGRADATAVWFVQRDYRSNAIRVFDYLEESGEALPYYAGELKSRGYGAYEAHVMPHDMKVTEWGSGVRRVEAAEQLGIRPIKIAQKLLVQEGIDAARRIFPRCYFDQTKCARGLDALRGYHKQKNETTGEFSHEPAHTWHSHGADAFRTGAVGGEDVEPETKAPEVDMTFDPYE